MSEEEINIAIAETSGLGRCQNSKMPIDEYWASLKDCGFLLNYCGDLNAMRKARSRIPVALRDLYMNWISRIVERERRMATINWLVLDATAIQHAEAFLRTLGKWKE